MSTGGDRTALEGAEQFDWIVVGGGAAGCVLAARLSERAGTSVLLLEAGAADRHPYVHIPAAFPLLFDGRLDWADRTAPQPSLGGRVVFWPRGRVLGGSSSINAMMWVRGMPPDYDTWATLAGPSWSFQQLLPVMRRIEHTDETLEDPGIGDEPAYGRAGPLRVSRPRQLNPLTAAWLASAGALGLGALAPNASEGEGVTAAMLTQRRGRRHSASDAYLRPARRRANLEVRPGCLVDRVLFDATRASGVTYLRRRRHEQVAARAGVVLTAGAVGTPAILLRSGVGPSGELARHGIRTVVDAPAVGENLQDHLTSGIVAAASAGVTLADSRTPRQLARFALLGRGLLTSNLAEGYGYLRSGAEAPAPDLELLFLPAAFVEEGLSMPELHGVTCAAVLLQPRSRGRVRLRSSDPSAGLEIDPRYLSDEGGEDLAVLSTGVRWCLHVIATEPLAGELGPVVVPDAAGAGVNAGGEGGMVSEELVGRAIRDHAQTLYHPVGTCAMGSAASSVLDPQLRVRGVTGLLVADASAIPAITRGHTLAPTMVIAERASGLIAQAGA